MTDVAQEQSEKSAVAVAQNDISTIKIVVKDIKDGQAELRKFFEEQISKLDEKYVTKAEFWPVKAIVYGGAGMILVGVFSILISLAFRR